MCLRTSRAHGGTRGRSAFPQPLREKKRPRPSRSCRSCRPDPGRKEPGAGARRRLAHTWVLDYLSCPEAGGGNDRRRELEPVKPVEPVEPVETDGELPPGGDPPGASGQVTQLLQEWADGELAARDRLIAVVYG